MLLALGTAFSSADFLKSLMARSSSTASAGSGQATGHTFGAAGTSSSADSAAASVRHSLPSGSIAPHTMKALLAAQGQSSGSDAAASSSPAAPADDSASGKNDVVPSGSIGVNWTDGTTSTSTIVPLTILDAEPATHLDMSVLKYLTGQ